MKRVNIDHRSVYIVDAVRTPIGRSNSETGIYRNVHAQTLLHSAYQGLARRQPALMASADLAMAGCVNAFGEQGGNVARLAWLAAGLPETTPGMSLDARCGSAHQAINLGAGQIAAGLHSVVVAAGIEHMGHTSFSAVQDVQERYGTPYQGALLDRYAIAGQGHGAELIATEYGVTRNAMDRFALTSHERAAAATAAGAFDRELVRVLGHDGPLIDQGIRSSTLEQLSALKPAFPDSGGRITAATSSQISDGAAAVVLASGLAVDRAGVRPRARIRSQAFVGCDPVKMLEGPIPATKAVLDREGMNVTDIDAFEVNEAFASVVLAWERAFLADMSRVNMRGGAIALGHPLGSTGARLTATMLGILEDEDLEMGLITMCCGGGLGTATLLERC